MLPDLHMQRALSRWAPVQQMALWSRRQWKVAGWSYLAALLLMGVIGETLPGASAGRVVPVQWWNYVTLVLSPPLIALIVATFVPDGQSRRTRRRGKAGVGAGGVAGTVAMACPVCNPIAIPVFGAAGVLSFLAPYRGVIALASVAFLAPTLALRLRAARTCQLAPRPSSQDPGTDRARQ
jgi:hypothetical protein